MYHTTGKVMQTQVSGNYIYAANGAGGLQIFDIENPLNPTWVTGVDLNGNATALTIEDDRVYLTLDNNSTAVIDISNPFTAKQIAKIKRPQPRITKPAVSPHITTHNGIQYISGSKTIIAKKLLPDLEVKKQD